MDARRAAYLSAPAARTSQELPWNAPRLAGVTLLTQQIRAAGRGRVMGWFGHCKHIGLIGADKETNMPNSPLTADEQPTRQDSIGHHRLASRHARSNGKRQALGAMS